MLKIPSHIKITVGLILALIFIKALWGNGHGNRMPPPERVRWIHLSSQAGDLEPPGAGKEQTASLILDIDQDEINDFVIAIRDEGPSLVWYRRHSDAWDRYVIDHDVLPIEAGGAFYDIDGDGDLDIVMGGDYRSNQIWWWENPYPDYDPDIPWTRREIKNSGANKHHDMMFGDFTGNGKDELVFWNQDANSLMLAEIPDNPKNNQTWPVTTIYSWQGGAEHEGLAKGDIDGDGKLNIIGGGRWFKHTGGVTFTAEIIDDNQRFSRAAVGQLKEGDRPQVVFVAGDAVGPLKWYEWDGSQWIGHDLLGHNVDHGHSLEVADIDGDGHLDIFVAEMRLNGGNPDAKMWIFYGDGAGNFEKTEVAQGYGNHESRIGDLNGNGQLDILGKPYNWETPRIDIWLNDQSIQLGHWERQVIDADRPGQAIFITAADLDGDGYKDIITGAFWYRNPGQAGGEWERRPIGGSLNNMAAVYDFDGDGHLDVLGTAGQGAEANSTFYWARNDGAGNFTILDNIDAGDGDFLQGVAVERFEGDQLSVALSWHQAGKGIQRLIVPPNPSTEQWRWEMLSPISQDEALSAGDIDGDGRIDLLLGTIWLRNNAPDDWTPYTLFETNEMPDRNRLADMNGNGRLDAVVGYEAIGEPGKLAWYEQGEDAAALWTEHIIADPPIIGPMSLDVADIDGDGDMDVVVGEHNVNQPHTAVLYIFENVDGKGTQWERHVVYAGDEHHDGAQLVDIDNDGDLDIISIGWTHGRVLLYENKSSERNTDSGKTAPTAPSGADACLDPAPLALYAFDEGDGAVVHDTSGVAPALDLRIQGGGTAWLSDGGLRIHSPVTIASTGPAARLTSAIQAANAVSVAAWIRPLNTVQDGPARIISISGDIQNRNLTLGQGLWGGQPSNVFNVRLRTTNTDLNGEPSLTTSPGSAGTELVHIIYTHNATGERIIYINGSAHTSSTATGSLSNWNQNYALFLGNESGGERPWLGEFHRVAFYACALSENEVTELFEAGPRPEAAVPGTESNMAVAIAAIQPPAAAQTSAIEAAVLQTSTPVTRDVLPGWLLMALPLALLAALLVSRKKLHQLWMGSKQ
jgi:hypothetical protein